MPNPTDILDYAESLGFDRSRIVTDEPETEPYVKLACSQCAAVCVNGIPCHETGCPNETHECKGCNASVTRNVRYCEDCQ